MDDGTNRRSRRAASALVLAGGMLLVWMALGAARASAATLSVCPHGCRYSQVSDAVAAAHEGDTVRVAPGAYRGGFAIDRSLTLLGAGAPVTVIRGGGPVITIGSEDATTEPTVTIVGVTITDGRTQSAFGESNLALGGGVWIPPSAGDGPGATVTIAASIITDNVAAPATSVDAGFSCGARGECQFAHAGGGGVASWGNLTLDHALVTGNAASGALTSDANGGGVYSEAGSLSVRDSIVAGNRATASDPNGRFAEGAGIMFDTFFSPGSCQAPAPPCAFSVQRSAVAGNASTLQSTLPAFGDDGQLIEMNANTGGVHVGDGIPTTVEDTTISGNSATAADPQGEPSAIDSGILVGDSPLTMSSVSVSANRATTISLTSEDAGLNGNPFELDGPGQLTNISVLDNLSTSSSPAGIAQTSGGLAVLNFTGDPQLVTVRDSVIRGNRVEASSQTGSAEVLGAGVFNNSLLDLRGVALSDNRAIAHAPSGDAQGGGIWNGVDISGPPVQLSLEHSSVLRNLAGGSAGILATGGGIFTTTPVTLADTRIALNRPDQCVGCASAQAQITRSRVASPVFRQRAVAGTPPPTHTARR